MRPRLRYALALIASALFSSCTLVDSALSPLRSTVKTLVDNPLTRTIETVADTGRTVVTKAIDLATTSIAGAPSLVDVALLPARVPEAVIGAAAALVK